MNLSFFPPLNASLNAACAVFLALGFVFIRRRSIVPHKTCMLAATAVSALFLASYLYYHAHHGATRFRGTGPVRSFYFGLLFSHTILAVANLPLIFLTLRRAFRGNFEAHKRVARWCLAVWFYVSVTGVAVYWMLYRMSFR